MQPSTPLNYFIRKKAQMQTGKNGFGFQKMKLIS